MPIARRRAAARDRAQASVSRGEGAVDLERETREATSVRAEREQDVARTQAKRAVAGADVDGPTRDGRPGTVHRSALPTHPVQRRELPVRIERPDDRAGR